MSSLWRVTRACLLLFVATMTTGALCASAASAATFYANQRSGEDSNLCTSPAAPCLTVAGAIKRAEAAPGPNTIELAAEGAFEEAVTLNSASDNNLTINGEEPGVVIVSKTNATVTVGANAGSVTFSNLHIGYQSGTQAALVDTGANVTLNNVTVDNESLSGKNGIEASKFGSVTLNGGKVTMAEGGSGDAIKAEETPLTLNGTTVTAEGLSEAAGIESKKSGLTLLNSKVVMENGSTGAEEHFGIRTTEDGSVTLIKDVIVQEGPADGVELGTSPATVNGLQLFMKDPASKATGVAGIAATAIANSTFAHLEVSGAWVGSALTFIGPSATVSDSRLITNSASAFALGFAEVGEGPGLLIQRTVLQASPAATHGSLFVIGANAIVDSSEILGGVQGVLAEGPPTGGGTRALTIAASTIDAGVPGVAGDASTTRGILATAKGAAPGVENVSVEGSIVLEPQTATVTAGSQANIACSYTAVPSQTQAAKGTEGAINCAAGSGGNTSSSGELATLFSEPLTNYLLGPTSSAINSVPASAISLPFGIALSGTDLNGHPRTRLAEIGGACVARQDKGAIEATANPSPCPPPPTAKATPGSITNLSISPNAFSAAPSGATISKHKKAKKKYGATVSYDDSQAATTTFTVLKPESGRMQGKSCKRPSRKNKHGKHCTLYTALGSFTHTDKAGANKFHFSGRLKSKKLAKGSYKLQAVAHNAAGNGAAVSKQFKIK